MISRRPAGVAVLAIVLTGLAFSIPPAFADDEVYPEVPTDRPLTAEETVQLALARNYLIRQADDLKGIEDANKLSAWGGFVPSLNLGYDWSRRSSSFTTTSGPTLDRREGSSESDIDGYSISASMLLVSLPDIFNIIAAGKNSGAATEEVRAAEQTAIQVVREQYYNVIEAIKLEEVAREDVRLAGEELRRTQSLFDVGSVARTDVLKSNVRVSEAQSAHTTATNRIRIERARLNRALALPPDTPVQLIESLEPRADNPDSATAYAQALEQRPDVKAARLRIAASSADHKSAWTRKLPFLGHSFQKGESDFDGEQTNALGELEPNSGNDRSWQYTISANWNILDGLVTESQIQRTKYNTLLNEHRLLDLETVALVETREAIVAIENAEAQIIVAREARVSAEEDLNLSQERYSVGLGTILELIDAQVNVSRTRTGEVTAMAALKRAEAQLDKAIGRTNW